MRIGINARFLALPYTGIGQYTRNLVRAMAQTKPEFEFLLFTPEMAEVNLPSNCKQIRVAEKPFPSASLQKAYWEHVLVPREMERSNLNLAHFPYPCNPRRRLPFPTIVTVHDVIPWKLPEYRSRLRSKLYHLYARLALKKADHLITVSEFSKAEMVKTLKIPAEKIAVILNAPPIPDEKRTYPELTLRRPFFLYVGGFDPRKNVPLLIHAYQKFIATYSAVDLVVVGGKGKGLESLFISDYQERVGGHVLKPKGKIILTNPLSQGELEHLYRQSLALVHPTFYEGFNLTLVEAMAAGIPIIASDIPVHHEVARQAALYVNPHSLNEVGNAMHQLIHDKDLQRRLAQKGLSRAKDFSWNKSAEETLYTYSLFT
jgi:glycosyltransferase involved in cell wall biosynthesis